MGGAKARPEPGKGGREESAARPSGLQRGEKGEERERGAAGKKQRDNVRVERVREASREGEGKKQRAKQGARVRVAAAAVVAGGWGCYWMLHAAAAMEEHWAR